MQLLRRIFLPEPQFETSSHTFRQGLKAIGIEAQKAKRQYDVYELDGGDSLGSIEILEGSIRWINVKEHRGVGQFNSLVSYHTIYGVPFDERYGAVPAITIQSVRVKSSPVFGRVVDMRWESDSFDVRVGLVDRLNADTLLKHPIINSYDVTIKSYPLRECWGLRTETGEVPTKELWDCYQSIAQHLLSPIDIQKEAESPPF